MSTRYRWTTAATVVALAATLLSAAQVAAQDFVTFKSDYASQELEKILNGDRATLGYSALPVDNVLLGKLRDGAIACPNNASLIHDGRSKDMADNNYFFHELRLCPSYTILDVLPSWGFNGSNGEIIAWNNYPADSTIYYYGCDINGNNCSQTQAGTVPAYVGSWGHQLMQSAGHRSIILGSYQRFACGSWMGSTGKKFATCVFATAGPSSLDQTPPVVQNATGAGSTVSGTAPFSATLHDTFRLSDGWLKLDANPTPIRQVAFNYNVATYVWTINLDTTTLSNGAHTLKWTARDTATQYTTFNVGFTVNN